MKAEVELLKADIRDEMNIFLDKLDLMNEKESNNEERN